MTPDDKKNLDKSINKSPEKGVSKADDNIVAQGINKFGNEYTVYKDGYSYRNKDRSRNVSSHYFNGGSSNINNYHETQRQYSWYENHNTGETNRPNLEYQKEQLMIKKLKIALTRESQN